MSKFFLKNTRKIILFGFAATLLLFGLNFLYNGQRDVLGQTVKPIICQEGSITDNELEIPIGEAADEAEEMARKIIEQADIIIATIPKEITAARSMTSLVNQCSSSRCSVSGCEKSTFDYDCGWKCDSAIICDDPIPGECHCSGGEVWKCEIGYKCEVQACAGEPCPYADINEQLNNVRNWFGIIKDAYFKIDDIFNKGKNSESFGWWPECPLECRPSKIIEKLDKARDRISDCIIRTEDLEARIRGERAGRFLLSCGNVMGLYLVDECYGNTICRAIEDAFRTPPPDWLCPRAENYYCCY